MDEHLAPLHSSLLVPFAPSIMPTSRSQRATAAVAAGAAATMLAPAFVAPTVP